MLCGPQPYSGDLRQGVTVMGWSAELKSGGEMTRRIDCLEPFILQLSSEMMCLKLWCTSRYEGPIIIGDDSDPFYDISKYTMEKYQLPSLHLLSQQVFPGIFESSLVMTSTCVADPCTGCMQGLPSGKQYGVGAGYLQTQARAA